MGKLHRLPAARLESSDRPRQELACVVSQPDQRAARAGHDN
jgi:hypothetical protein